MKSPPLLRYEVEVKFRLTDVAVLERLLASRGLAFGAVSTQRDIFFQHPSRDFAQTDEGLRLRIESVVGEMSSRSITYKGPKLDAVTKTRREIDLPLTGTGDIESWSELLQALGFSLAAEVCKERAATTLNDSGRDWTLTRDRLLPSSIWRDGERRVVVTPEAASLFCEIETVVTMPSELDMCELDTARHQLLQIAASLGLTDSARTSYLEIIAAAR